MKKLIFICLLFFSATSFAQNFGTISGTIVDVSAGNEPLLFANVSLKSTSKKEETNFHGNFKMTEVKTGKYKLVVTYAGYETVEIPVRVKKNKTTIVDSALATKTLNMEDITLLTLTAKKQREITLVSSDNGSRN